MSELEAFESAASPANADYPDLWALDAAQMMEDLGISPDPWQVDFLRSNHKQFILVCSRRAGKTAAVAVKCLHHAMFSPPGKPATVMLFAPAGKQTEEVLHELHKFYGQLGHPVPRESDKISILDFANGSRIIPFTNNEASARNFTPTLIVIDEGSRVDDVLYKALTPMMALGKAGMITLSTFNGKRGWFYKEWSGKGSALWKRVMVTADECPRISKAFIEDERLKHGDSYVAQEYYCSATQMEGLVYPEFESCIIDPCPIMVARAFGGADFGWNNPSAFPVVLLDTDDVAYVVDEIYGSRMTDEEFGAKAYRLCRRYNIEIVVGDSAAPQSIEKLRRIGIPIRPAKKGPGSVKSGISSVGERLRTGRLKIFRTCTNIINEAGLYSYDPDKPKDDPIDADNHCLDALRYEIVGAVDLGRTPKKYASPEDAAADQRQRVTEEQDERHAIQFANEGRQQRYLEREGWESF